MDPIPVKQGDNLTKIARRYDTTVEELLKLNPQLKDRPNTIFVGEKINLPKPPSETPYPGLGVEMQNDGIPKAPWQEGGTPQAPQKTKPSTQTEGYSMGTVVTVGTGTYMAGVGSKILYDKYGNAIGKYVKGKLTKMGEAARKKINAAKHRLRAAAGELRNNKFVKGDQAKLDKAKADTKNQTKKTINDAQGKNAKGKKVKSTLGRNIKNGYLRRDIHGSARKAAQDATKDKLINNPKETVKSYKRTFKAGSKAFAKSAVKRVASKIATPLAAAFECYNIAKAYKQGGTKKAVKQAGVSGASLGGAWAGAKAGAAVGAFGGPVGAVIGGVVGGVIGYAAGNWLGRKVIG